MTRLIPYLIGVLALSFADAFTTRSSSAVFGRIYLSHRQQRLHSSVPLQYQANATVLDLGTVHRAMEPFLSSPVLLSTEDQKETTTDQDNDRLCMVGTTSSTTITATKKEKEPMSDVVKARLLLLCAAALYGTNFSLVKILGETGMSVGLSSTLRFGMAALVTAPWLLKVEKEHKDSRWETLFDPNGREFQAAMAGLEVGMWNSIGYVAQAVGLETTSASKSAFLCSLAVVMVPMLDYLSGKKLLTRQVVGAVLAVIGVGVLELEGMSSLSDFANSLEPGDIASLIQPIAFGLGFWRVESAMSKFPNEADRATGAQLLAVFLGSAAYMVVMGTFVDPSTIPDMNTLVSWVTDPVILGALFWTGVVTTALTIYMETVALKTLSAAETTLIFSTEPLWGSAFACTVMGETFGMNAAFGAIMIMSGCLWSNLDWKRVKLPSSLAFLSGMLSDKENKAIEMEWEADIPTNPNLLPTEPVGKLSLKSSVAGVLTVLIASMESASSEFPSTIISAEGVQESIESLNNLPPP